MSSVVFSPDWILNKYQFRNPRHGAIFFREPEEGPLGTMACQCRQCGQVAETGINV